MRHLQYLSLPAIVNRKSLFVGLAIAGSLLTIPAGKSEVLYELKTTCTKQKGQAQSCTIQAINEASVTLYRHRFRNGIETIRITDEPVKMSRWDTFNKEWVPLKRASARFSTNTVCFNGTDLCAINPNYLNSLREDRPERTAGRDLVNVIFGSDGRIVASCYDSGCQESFQ